MSELEKYAAATVAVIVFLLGTAFLAQQIPVLIRGLLP